MSSNRKDCDINIRISKEHRALLDRVIGKGTLSKIVRAALLLYARSGYFRKHVNVLMDELK